MSRHSSFESFKQRLKDIGKPKSVDLDYLSAKGFCAAAIVEYDKKKPIGSTGSPLNKIIDKAAQKIKEKIQEKDPNIHFPPMGNLSKSVDVGTTLFINNELGRIDPNERILTKNVLRRDLIDKYDGTIDPEDQTIWKKGTSSRPLTPRDKYQLTSEEVAQAIKEAIVEFGTEYAATHSRLGQAKKNMAPLQIAEDSRSSLGLDTDSGIFDQDSESLPSPSPSQKSFDSGVSDINSTFLGIDEANEEDEEDEDKSKFTP